MTALEKRLYAWIIVASAWATLLTLIGFLSLVLADQNSSPIYWGIFAVATPAWIGVVLALEGRYSAAKVLLWIGGILGLPLGLILIRAGTRIKQVGDSSPVKRS